MPKKKYYRPSDFSCDRIKRFLDKCMGCPKSETCQQWKFFLNYVRKRKNLLKDKSRFKKVL